ncbi:hypothetical protein [Sphingomonas sp.]|uniref:hypothetical protein n=1 Tax=Sphingomonas sp. TaxID=28214 RepID=UPI0025CF1469|nr:hypothetical protein [Sphingomonas sp.]MBV9527046.1 hypothetical protein [Sphingomonas sp.]
MTTSTVLLGDNYLLWIAVNSGTPTYAVINGQGTATINRLQTEIDTSSKSSAGYATSAYGLRKANIDLDILPTLPDTGGYTEFETLCAAQPAAPFLVQIRRNGASGADPADTVFAALMYGSIQSTAFTQNDKVSVKAQLALAAAPTVDALK